LHQLRKHSFLDVLGSASSIWSWRTGSPAQRAVLREDATRIRFSRDLRQKLFDRIMFGEPAWDILLGLYVIYNDRRRLSTRQLSKLANLPLTTALRWLDYLEQQGLIRRLPSSSDHRVVDIELSDKGRASMDGYLLQMRSADIFEPTAMCE
jgi:DNA-binding MarR family transcriptional regulator